ncbi:MAG: hypothetical protein JWM64_1741 [Frankiales bacterium]|nr:hypothetical protein [Frankiales bacterium]
MTGGDLSVSGGAAGVAADLADLRRVADLLDRYGTDVSGLAGRTRSATTAGCLLGSAAWSPGTAARAEAALLAAAGALTLDAVRLEGSAVVLRTRARLLELADSGVDLLEVTAERTVARAAGAVAGALAVPLAVGVVLTGAALYTGELARDAGQLQVDVLSGRIPVSEYDDALRGLPGQAAGDLRDDALDWAQQHRLADRAGGLLVEHPGITDAVTGGLPDFLQGAAGPLAPLLPSDLEETVAALLAAGRLGGLFADPELTVTERPVDRRSQELEWGSLRDLFVSQETLMAATKDDPTSSTVRVRKVVGTDGVVRWVVQVPGTQQWSPKAGGDPSDSTSNLELMDDGQAALARAVLTAMHDAHVGADDDVLLTGHSQGGIAALAVASDPAARARFHGMHDVVTAGSPVSRLHVPPDVRVLSLENDRDPVPRLDGQDNPDAPNWTTVRRDALPDIRATPGTGAQDALDPIANHAVPRYQALAGAVDDSCDGALVPVHEALEPFLSGSGETQDYVLHRPQEH